MRTIDVALAERSYPILIGPGLIDGAEALTRLAGGRQVAIVTDDVGAEGGAGGAARAVGAGALIGAAAGDAGKGAAIGAGVALLAGGKDIQVPADAIVEVSLKQNVTLE